MAKVRIGRLITHPWHSKFTTDALTGPAVVVVAHHGDHCAGLTGAQSALRSQKKKSGVENINSRLALVMKSGKALLGYKSTMKSLRQGKGETGGPLYGCHVVHICLHIVWVACVRRQPAMPMPAARNMPSYFCARLSRRL